MTIVALIVVAACSNRTDEDPLRAHLSELLHRHGTTPAEMSCPELEGGAQATCEFRTPREKLDLAIIGLRLTQVDKPTIYYAEEKCRTIPAFSDRNRIALYESARHGPELRLSNGRAFEYLILYQDLSSDEVCAQFAYADQ
jgi:hypothetical protein